MYIIVESGDWRAGDSHFNRFLYSDRDIFEMCIFILTAILWIDNIFSEKKIYDLRDVFHINGSMIIYQRFNLIKLYLKAYKMEHFQLCRNLIFFMYMLSKLYFKLLNFIFTNIFHWGFTKLINNPYQS